eukprot:COSAG05_NODE_23471_length_258_cov_0.490566_1_plen_53_part_01
MRRRLRGGCGRGISRRSGDRGRGEPIVASGAGGGVGVGVMTVMIKVELEERNV